MNQTDMIIALTATQGSRWFIADHRKKSGPFPWHRLVSMAAHGELAPDVMLFKEGSKRWVRAKTLSALFGSQQGSAPTVASAPTRPATEMRKPYISEDTFVDETEPPIVPRTFPAYVAVLDDVDGTLDPVPTDPLEQTDSGTDQSPAMNEPALVPPEPEVTEREEMLTAPPSFSTASLAFESFLKRVGGTAAPETSASSEEPQRVETEVESDDAAVAPATLPDIMPSPRWSPADVMAAVRDMEPAQEKESQPSLFAPPNFEDEPATSAATAVVEPEIEQDSTVPVEEPVKRRIPWLMEAVTAASVSLMLGTSIVLGFFVSEWSHVPELKIESREELKEPVLQTPTSSKPEQPKLDGEEPTRAVTPIRE